MTKEEREVREGLDRWIDERIRLAFGSLTHPFEKRIARLRERVELLQSRLHRASSRLEETAPRKKLRSREKGASRG